jgi:uncharacterized RDD family membrane protein YckC
MMAPAPADRYASYDDLIRAIELASVEHMRPAGLWVRSMATLADLIIASLASAAIILPLRALFGSTSGDLGPYIFLIYVLYATALVARNGRTLGDWLFELEIVDAVTGHKPTLARAAIRAGVPMVLPLAGYLLQLVLRLTGRRLDFVVDGLVLCGMIGPPIALVWASLRSLGKQTIWDKLSHTLVRYRTRRTTAI